MNNTGHPIPDGSYAVEIVSMERKTDKNNKRIVEWQLKVNDGPFTGTMIPKKFHLSNDAALRFLDKELEMLSIEAPDGETFDKEKAKAIGKTISISAVTNKDDFQAYYVKKVLQSSPSESERISKW